jgi:hypothetical protein
VRQDSGKGRTVAQMHMPIIGTANDELRAHGAGDASTGRLLARRHRD